MSNFPLMPAYQRPLIAIITITVAALFLSSLSHAEQRTDAITQLETIGTLNEDNLANYVTIVSEDFYQQQQLLAEYFKVYQQKKDPRGFNVWHLRGYLPQFRELNQAHQEFAMENATFLAGQSEYSLLESIAALEAISTRLMIAMRENDPETYHAAFELNTQHSDLIAEALTRHQLDENIQHISLR